MTLHLHAGRLQVLHHFRAQVLIVVGRRNGEVAFLHARTEAQVVLGAARVPAAFLRVNEIKAVLRRAVEAHIVKNVELGLRAEKRLVANAGCAEISFRPLRDSARIARIGLARGRIDRVADHHQRRRVAERVHERRVRIGDQQHVRLVNRGPAADRAGVESKAVLEGIFV